MERAQEILGLFPDYMRKSWSRTLDQCEELQEIRLRTDRPVLLSSGRREYFIGEDDLPAAQEKQAKRTDSRQMQDILNHICRYSLYAFTDELKQGYLTVPGGHRIGIAGQVVLSGEGLVQSIKNIAYMNIRISHEVKGAADSILPFLYEKGEPQNVMIISPPGCGKTTLLRDLIRQVSDGNRFGRGRTVGVVDERSEIAGSYQGIAQNDVGYRSDIMDACPKALGMLMLLRSMAPRVIAVDELGEREDIQALGQAVLSGVGLMVTIHGEGIEDVKHRVYLQEILKRRYFKRFVVLGREKGMCRIRGIYNEAYEKCLSG